MIDQIYENNLQSVPGLQYDILHVIGKRKILEQKNLVLAVAHKIILTSYVQMLLNNLKRLFVNVHYKLGLVNPLHAIFYKSSIFNKM